MDNMEVKVVKTPAGVMAFVGIDGIEAQVRMKLTGEQQDALSAQAVNDAFNTATEMVVGTINKIKEGPSHDVGPS